MFDVVCGVLTGVAVVFVATGGVLEAAGRGVVGRCVGIFDGIGAVGLWLH